MTWIKDIDIDRATFSFGYLCKHLNSHRTFLCSLRLCIYLHTIHRYLWYIDQVKMSIYSPIEIKVGHIRRNNLSISTIVTSNRYWDASLELLLTSLGLGEFISCISNIYFPLVISTNMGCNKGSVHINLCHLTRPFKLKEGAPISVRIMDIECSTIPSGTLIVVLIWVHGILSIEAMWQLDDAPKRNNLWFAITGRAHGLPDIAQVTF